MQEVYYRSDRQCSYRNCGGDGCAAVTGGCLTGCHRSLGKYLAIPQIVQAVKALLCLKNIRRAQGEAGQVVMEGAFPKSFAIACDSAD